MRASKERLLREEVEAADVVSSSKRHQQPLPTTNDGSPISISAAPCWIRCFRCCFRWVDCPSFTLTSKRWRRRRRTPNRSFLLLLLLLLFFVVVVLFFGGSHYRLDSSSKKSSTVGTLWTASATTLPSHIFEARIGRRNNHNFPKTQASIFQRISRRQLSSSSKEKEEEAKQQQQQKQLWMYQGSLYDPLDGRPIAQVQGLELVRPVFNTTHLAIDKILWNNNNNNTYVDAKTLWSQKIFCYTTTTTTTAIADDTKGAGASNNNNHNGSSSISDDDVSILQSVRVRPQSPKKKIPLDQAVIVYETATTFVSLPQNNNNNNNKETLLVYSEFPNGQTLWGMANDHHNSARRRTVTTANNWQSSSSSSSSSPLTTTGIDFTVYTKIRSPKSPMFAPDLTVPSSFDDDNNKNKGDLVVSPKRSALIQFGGSSTVESKHKFGARETYSYRNHHNHNNPIPIIHNNNKPWWWQQRILGRLNDQQPTATTSLFYTRYGEGPPFYAPGRMCMLELHARPIEKWQDATPLLRRLLDTHVANFDGVVIKEEEEVGPRSSTRTIQEAWGRLENSRDQSSSSSKRRRSSSPSPSAMTTLCLKNYNVEESESTKGLSKVSRWMHKRTEQAMNAWEALQRATAIEASL
jgi:hypothetical protein